MAKKEQPLNPAQQLYLARQMAERGTCPTDDEFMSQFPAVWSLLTTWWLDDTHRIEAARMEIQVLSGDWLFKLSSPSLRGHKQVVVPTFASGLRELELTVADPSRPWMFWLKRKAAIAKQEPLKNGLAGLDGK